LSYTVFCFLFSLLFRFCAVREIKLAISSAFERTLVYRIASYRMVGLQRYISRPTCYRIAYNM